MTNFDFDFQGSKNIHDILDVLYEKLNSILGAKVISRGVRDNEFWDAYYDDVFGVLSDESFVKKYGNKIHFSMRGLGGFKENQPENYKKFLEWVMDYQKDELPNHGVIFSYEIVN